MDKDKQDHPVDQPAKTVQKRNQKKTRGTAAGSSSWEHNFASASRINNISVTIECPTECVCVCVRVSSMQSI